MGQGIDALRAANRATVELESGLTYGLRLPRIADCIAAGDIPLPVLQHLETKARTGETEPTMTAEEMAATLAFNDTLVRRSIETINGDPVDLSADDVRDIPETDYQEIVLYAMRAKPLPGKG